MVLLLLQLSMSGLCATKLSSLESRKLSSESCELTLITMNNISDIHQLVLNIDVKTLYLSRGSLHDADLIPLLLCMSPGNDIINCVQSNITNIIVRDTTVLSDGMEIHYLLIIQGWLLFIFTQFSQPHLLSEVSFIL